MSTDAAWTHEHACCHRVAHPQVLRALGQEGVLVLEVPPGSPGHAAGLRHTHRDIFGDVILGDVIVGLDGRCVLGRGMLLFEG